MDHRTRCNANPAPRQNGFGATVSPKVANHAVRNGPSARPPSRQARWPRTNRPACPWPLQKRRISFSATNKPKSAVHDKMHGLKLHSPLALPACFTPLAIFLFFFFFFWYGEHENETSTPRPVDQSHPHFRTFFRRLLAPGWTSRESSTEPNRYTHGQSRFQNQSSNGRRKPYQRQRLRVRWRREISSPPTPEVWAANRHVDSMPVVGRILFYPPYLP